MKENPIVAFNSLLTDTSIIEAGTRVAALAIDKRDSKAIGELVDAIVNNPASGTLLDSLDKAKSYIDTLLTICGTVKPKSGERDYVSRRNRFNYVVNSAKQSLCEKLGLADDQTSIFDLSAYLEKVCKKLASEKVDQAIVDAILAIIPENDPAVTEE